MEVFAKTLTSYASTPHAETRLIFADSTFTMTMTRSASPNQILSRICAYVSLVDIFESFDRLESPSKVLRFAYNFDDSFQAPSLVHSYYYGKPFINLVDTKAMKDINRFLKSIHQVPCAEYVRTVVLHMYLTSYSSLVIIPRTKPYNS
ncbi:hypothetical protein EAE96_011003 [Botrytis aclada]|nr:hypothetical protein EAE96_011003 [Botrytis aclada]